MSKRRLGERVAYDCYPGSPFSIRKSSHRHGTVDAVVDAGRSGAGRRHPY